jgi:CubicO group peptidase (beta-lactamase class C family)
MVKKGKCAVTDREQIATKGRRGSFLFIVNAIQILLTLIASGLIASVLSGCSRSTEELEAVDYTPLLGDDWQVSTPEEQGLDPLLMAELYHNAAELQTLYGLLVVKNGYLIAEDYFNEGSVDSKNELQSATKSVTSALVGAALEQGCLSSLDQKMMAFFPEFAGQLDDPRKEQITIRDMLQMRSGYPDEETGGPALWEALLSGDYMPLIEDIALTSDPGTKFQYSGLTSHWLGVIVARACDADLKSIAQEYLFSPINAEVGEWLMLLDGYYSGLAGLHISARDMARFGLLYLNDGQYEGKQLLSVDYVRDSLQRYSEGLPSPGYFSDRGYGYQWWSARVGDREFNYAAGHGGQMVVLLDELDMVIVTTSDPFWQQHDEESWKHESAIIKLVGKFIKSLPEV